MRTVGIIDRVILALYTISLGLVSIVLMFMAGGWRGPLAYIEESMTTPLGRVGLGVVGLILFIVSLRLAVVALGVTGSRRSVVHDLPMGRVKVSLDAIEGLVGRLIRAQPGVKDARAVVVSTDHGLTIRVHATVGPELSISESSEDMQRAVQEQVKQVVGVAVERVLIDVVRITPETRRARVD